MTEFRKSREVAEAELEAAYRDLTPAEKAEIWGPVWSAPYEPPFVMLEDGLEATLE